PLQKKNDVEFELQARLKEIQEEGHQLLEIERNNVGEIVIIYRQYFYDGDDDDLINIEAIVITKDGVRVPYPIMHVIRREKDRSLYIADIKVLGESINKGYGSLMMKHLLDIAKKDKERVMFVTGNMSSEGDEHRQRQIHFYKKCGFICHEEKILWINDGIELSTEQISDVFSRIVLADPQVFGIRE
ncbi:Acetyltransferase (GNAT) family protein, partial [Aneurinibacillus thermoaerophilus]